MFYSQVDKNSDKDFQPKTKTHSKEAEEESSDDFPDLVVKEVDFREVPEEELERTIEKKLKGTKYMIFMKGTP